MNMLDSVFSTCHDIIREQKRHEDRSRTSWSKCNFGLGAVSVWFRKVLSSCRETNCHMVFRVMELDGSKVYLFT